VTVPELEDVEIVEEPSMLPIRPPIDTIPEIVEFNT
jgi:hypothetical protein